MQMAGVQRASRRRLRLRLWKNRDVSMVLLQRPVAVAAASQRWAMLCILLLIPTDRLLTGSL